MDIAEYRRHAHRLVDWMADYLETVESRPVRSGVAPGEIEAGCPPLRRKRASPSSGYSPTSSATCSRGSRTGSTRRSTRYFPANSSPPLGARRDADRHPRRELHAVADVARRHRARDPRPRLAAADVGAPGGFLGGHPGHRIERDPVRDPRRPGAGDGVRGEPPRGIGRGAAPALYVGRSPFLGREGGAHRGAREREPARDSDRRGRRHALRRARGVDRARRGGGGDADPGRRHRRHHRRPPDSTGWTESERSAGAATSCSTWTRRGPAPRPSSPNTAGCSTGSSTRTASWSTLTSG